MADCGGLPQVVQVSPTLQNGMNLTLNWTLLTCWFGEFFVVITALPVCTSCGMMCVKRILKDISGFVLRNLVCCFWFFPPFLLLKPGKLAEAFKYFVQGMGYSEYRSHTFLYFHAHVTVYGV